MAKAKAPKPPKAAKPQKTAAPYVHPEQQAAMRPDVGTQSNFRKKKAPTTYRYDSSLSPALDWDGQNGARELGEWLLTQIDEAAGLPAPHQFPAAREFKTADGRVLTSVSSLTEAVAELKRIGKPFLTWTGKAERLSFDVPTLPLFVHERLSTKAIVDTLVGHKRDKQIDMYSLFGDPQHSITDQVGVVPHITLGSIANDEPPKEEILVDRPNIDQQIVRVTGPFAFEATIPTPVDWEGDGEEDSGSEQAQEYGSFVERMIEVLRRSPVLHVGGGKTVTLGNVRPPAKSLSLSAEALSLNGSEKPVAFVFGPENGAISEKLVHGALTEAHLKGYTHLYVVGFAIQPHARTLIENAAAMGLVAATYVQATPDLMMGDLLKNMRSSQIFSVCGLPEIKVHKVPPAEKGGAPRFQIELLGLDTFDPTTMEPDHRAGNDVPAWFLDADYNNLCFHVSQAFFPRTGAWGDLRKALKGDYDDSVWDHLAGTKSAPFEAGQHTQVAVKVIDDRGNELLVVQAL